MRFLFAVAVIACLSRNLAAYEPAREPLESALPRQVMFGANLAAVSKDVREQQKLTEDGGVVLTRIHAGTAAADAEFKSGDVITGDQRGQSDGREDVSRENRAGTRWQCVVA